MKFQLSKWHWNGGKEYYVKMLIRHRFLFGFNNIIDNISRILRELLGEDGKALFLKSGDVRSTSHTSLLKRFNTLLDVVLETDYVSAGTIHSADDLGDLTTDDLEGEMEKYLTVI